MNFGEQIAIIKELGEESGLTVCLENLLEEIHNTKEKIQLISCIKAANGILQLIDDYNLRSAFITLDVDRTFGEDILCAKVDFNVDNQNYEYEDIETHILSHLSNVRFEQPFLDNSASYFFKAKGVTIALKRETFKNEFINSIVNKETVLTFNEQELRHSLSGKCLLGSKEIPNKI